MNLSPLKLILLVGAAQGAILGLLLATRKHNRVANRILAFLLFLLSIHLVLVAFDERNFFMHFPHLSHITWLLPVLYGPLVLLYVRRITMIAPSFRKEEFLFFLPFVIWLGVLLPYYLQPASVKQAYLDNYELSVKDDFGLLNQLTNFIHLFFFGLAILVYHRHEQRILQFYSDLTRVRLRWLRDFLYGSLAIIIMGIFIFYARKYHWSYLSNLYPFHFLGVVLLIYWIAYQAVARPVLFTAEYPPVEDLMAEALPANSGMKDEEPPVAESQDNKPDDRARKKLAGELKRVLEEEKLFLNPELTLQDLTDRLQSNKQYVSDALNNVLGKTFYDFVNDYRVEEFKRHVADPANRHLTLLALAYESGFNSKATFNAIFKKKTGLTPSQYSRKVQ